MNLTLKKFNYLNTFNLGLAVFIILWGAWVRLSGSGAGCGDHWPLCNGEVIPMEPSLKTLIEYVHRLTSGVFGITVFASAILARKLFNRGEVARKFAYASLFFTITEALIGAVLVKKGLVVDNSSVLRAWVIGFHLVNTFILLAALVGQLTVTKTVRVTPMKPKSKLIWFSASLVFLLVGATGAISALGNTLFPETSLIAGVMKDFDSSSHFLIRLRIFHPLLAIILFGLIQYISLPIKTKLSKSLSHTSWVAVFFGAINWMLLAPKWGALTHLLIADILWCLFVGVFIQAYFKKAE